MQYDASWLVLVGILPLTFYVASMRERMRIVERKLDAALSDYENLRAYIRSRDPAFPDAEEDEFFGSRPDEGSEA